ncbi:unnamed protein product, partial [Rotaria sp. Silwood2]
MSYQIYHGDPDRENNFWVYPKEKALVNSRWDAYDPSHLCNDFTLLDNNLFTGVRRYKCNGHENVCYGGGSDGVAQPSIYPNAAIPNKFYHGDPSRENNFWVYPRHEPLIDTRWDAYNPSYLCNNYTLLENNSCTKIRRYRCNGHDSTFHGRGRIHRNRHRN